MRKNKMFIRYFKYTNSILLVFKFLEPELNEFFVNNQKCLKLCKSQKHF